MLFYILLLWLGQSFRNFTGRPASEPAWREKIDGIDGFWFFL